jgi:hypothetical protein
MPLTLTGKILLKMYEKNNTERDLTSEERYFLLHEASWVAIDDRERRDSSFPDYRLSELWAFIAKPVPRIFEEGLVWYEDETLTPHQICLRLKCIPSLKDHFESWNDTERYIYYKMSDDYEALLFEVSR